MARLPPSRKILAALQLKNQIIQKQATEIEAAHEQHVVDARRAKVAETALDAVAK